jgi:hypothetical protein
MNPADLQSILSAVLRQQEQWNAAGLRDQEERFAQLTDTLRVANGVPAAITPTEQRNSQPPQLPDIDAYVVDMDWLTITNHLFLTCAPSAILLITFSTKIRNGIGQPPANRHLTA